MKLLKNKSFIVFLGILLVLFIGLIFIVINNNKINKKIENDVLKAIPDEFLDFGFYHNGTARKCLDDKCENYEYLIIYQSYIKGKVNEKDINVEVKNKKILINLPDFIIEESEFLDIEVFEVSENSELKPIRKNFIDICKKDLKEKVKNKDKEIINDSENISVPKIKEFFESWIKENYNGYKLEVK